LNVLIQKSVNGGVVTEEEFEEKALELINKGIVGFGELAAEHIIIGGTEPYVHLPPNHFLFKKLADIAGENNLPTDLHMEAVTEEIATPTQFASNPSNPT